MFDALPALRALAQDIRFALRLLRRAPGFAAVAVLTFALGIGANTAIFTVVHALVLKPLPYAESDQLFNVFQARPQDGVTGTGWSYPNFQDLRSRTTSFSGMAGTQKHQLTLTGRGDPAVVNASAVTPELFAVFLVKPLFGRTFIPDDGNPGAAPVAVVSEGLWRSHFGADPAIIGTSVELDKRSFTIVGVMPSTFRFPLIAGEQIWIPLAQDPLFSGWMEGRKGHWLQVTGRLKPDVTPTQARAELDALASALATQFPAENSGWLIRAVPLQDMIVGDTKGPLLVLLGAVGLVLLIACANISNLLLSRAASRAREMAVRATLGAGRGRIVRQLLCEALVLGLVGGAVGIVLAFLGVQALASLLPPGVPQVNAIQVDGTVLSFAVLLSVIASCAFGLAPAWFAAEGNVRGSLQESGGRSSESRGRRRLRSVLAAAELALAMVLLVGAGLLLRSFTHLLSVNPGFTVQQLVLADVSLPRFQYATPSQWVSFADRFLAGLQRDPGLRESAVAVPRPIADRALNLVFDVPAHPPAPAGSSRTANYVSVTPGYFRVMSIPLVAGRLFDHRDVASARRVSLISQAFARRYFPNEDPVGKKLVFGFPPDGLVVREIVGIVGDVRDAGLGQEPGPLMYVPFAQAPFWGANVVVRSPLSAAAVAQAIRREVGKIDNSLPVTAIAAMPDILNVSLAQPRFRALMLGMFAAMALALAATGIFGVISHSVLSRTSEIGIRLALGASRGAILRMVLRETLLLALAGLMLGIPSALLASRVLGRMLFDVPPYDPATISAVALCLVGVALLSAYVPARNAMRVDPIVALRYE